MNHIIYHKGNEYDTQLISKKDKKFNVSILTNLIRRKRDGTFKIYREVFITIRVKEENSKFLFDEKDYFIKSNYHQISAIYLADNYNENWSDSKKLNCSYIGYTEEDKDKIITVIRAEYLDEDLAVKFTINKEIKDNTITITAKEVDKTEIKR
ncbi:hypothetical protein [Caloranaerobacter ferrireducens]|uniref:hypothetical protein n=1 Tax=Caloranaerobacter ferrireducens TaxID=1323370 RepID=UPI00084D366D|nr:hypothetical protein [Caloranaerobacter ferrireducens]